MCGKLSEGKNPSEIQHLSQDDSVSRRKNVRVRIHGKKYSGVTPPGVIKVHATAARHSTWVKVHVTTVV